MLLGKIWNVWYSEILRLIFYFEINKIKSFWLYSKLFSAYTVSKLLFNFGMCFTFGLLQSIWNVCIDWCKCWIIRWISRHQPRHRGVFTLRNKYRDKLFVWNSSTLLFLFLPPHGDMNSLRCRSTAVHK